MIATEPSPSAQFSALLSRSSPKIVALVKKCLPKLLRAIPQNYQIVYDYGKSVVVSLSLTEQGYEAIGTLAIYRDELRLYFLNGKILPDPEGLLKGSASKVRYINIEAASDLEREDIKALIEAAIKQAGTTIPRNSTSQVIIKSSSKKKSKAKKKAKKKAGR